MYGLLLPEADTSVQKEVQSKPATGKPVQRRHTVTGDSEVIMRRTKKTRNRKSAVYGESDDVTNNSNTEAAATGSTDKTKSPVHDMKVKLVSFSPENSIDNGDESSDGVLETRQGKVSDLVKQFEEEEKATEAKQQSNGSTGGENSVKEAKNDESEEKVKGKKKRPTSKAFDMFEKSGMIMGMVSSLFNMCCMKQSHCSHSGETCISTAGRTIFSLQSKSSILRLGSQDHPCKYLLLYNLNEPDPRGEQR